METNRICPKCGHPVTPNTLFCPNCGALLEPDDKTINTFPTGGASHLRAGTILHERYEIRKTLGQGGFGITYEGLDRILATRIAVKEYYPRSIVQRQSSDSQAVTVQAESDRGSYERGLTNFLHEARNQAKFSSDENIVHVQDFFQANSTAYIVMEFVDGITLDKFLKRNGPLSIDECMGIFVPIMNSLERLHAQGLIHRDISPSNIMMRRDGRVKLLDFGSARDTNPEYQTFSVVLKPAYAPIEQYYSHSKQGPYTDVYSLSATIYTMLTGVVPPNPFERMSSHAAPRRPSSMGVRLSPMQEKTLMKGLEVQVPDRVQTIAELRNGLLDASERTTVPIQEDSGRSGGSGDHDTEYRGQEEGSFRSGLLLGLLVVCAILGAVGIVLSL